MRRERQSLEFSGMRNKYLLLFCVAAFLCFSQISLAQSGRHKGKTGALPPPPATTEQKDEPASNRPTIIPVPVSTVIIVADLIQSGKSRSNYADRAIDACVKRLKNRPVIEATDGGSIKRMAAIELAKQEPGAFVLLMEIKLEREDLYEKTIKDIDYFVFMPQTGKVLTEGRVYPGKKQIITGGVIGRIPTQNKPLPLSLQLELSAEEVADRVKERLLEHLPKSINK